MYKRIFVIFLVLPMILVVLSASLVSCRNEAVTNAPTAPSTAAPTEPPTDGGTEAATAEPTEQPTEGLTVQYDFSGSYKITNYSAWIDPKDARECTDDAIISILNQGLWEKEIPTTEYEYKLAVNDKVLWYSTVRGVFANITDNRHLELSFADRQTVNDAFEKEIPLFWHVWDTGELHPTTRYTLKAGGAEYITIEDRDVIALIGNLISQALESGTLEKSSKGYYGASFSLTADTGDRSVTINIIDQTRYITSLHEDSEGYPYLYRADLSELYNYLRELWHAEK